MCYKLVQGFRVTCLFTGRYNTKGYDTITDVIFRRSDMVTKIYLRLKLKCNLEIKI